MPEVPVSVPCEITERGGNNKRCFFFRSFSSVIDGEPLRFRGEVFHPYHFNCTGCGNELTSSGREVRTRPGYTAQELVRPHRGGGGLNLSRRIV